MALYILVNIGSGNRLLLDGTKPLPENVDLSSVRSRDIHLRAISQPSTERTQQAGQTDGRTDGQTDGYSDINHWKYLEDIGLETFLSKISLKSPRGQWVKFVYYEVHDSELLSADVQGPASVHVASSPNKYSCG